MVSFVNPSNGHWLERRNDTLYDTETGVQVARIEQEIPRFAAVQPYAESFGWQWNRWEDTLSDSRRPSNKNAKRSLLLERTRFDAFDMQGKTILECGMGGGDDTEILLSLPFAAVHSFDISNSVDRARRYLNDARLVISQADIFEIPYPDESFDFVFCHRVLQHTPAPERALRCVSRKVKPGGVLFVHCYHRSLHFMLGYKYKYRWLTKRLPVEWVAAFLDRYVEPMHRINERIQNAPRLIRPLARLLGQNFLLLERIAPNPDRPREHTLDLVKLITFDALTPTYDKPMRWKTMERILRLEGFEIYFKENRSAYPLWCTSVKAIS